MFSRTALLIATAAVALGAQAASAQSVFGDTTTSFRGFRIEGNAGYDRASSEGNRNSKFAYGGSAGFDGQIGNLTTIRTPSSRTARSAAPSCISSATSSAPTCALAIW
jgi:outer membrane immunogenic protein